MGKPSGLRSHHWGCYLTDAEAAALDTLRTVGGSSARPLSRAGLMRALALDALGRSQDPCCRSALAALLLDEEPDGSRGGRPPTTHARTAQDATGTGGRMQEATPPANGAPGPR